MYSASAGIAVATQSASSVFYNLTDHNRGPIDTSYELLEKSQRMADGTMRKYVVAKKKKITTDWRELPSGTGAPANSGAYTGQGMTLTVDGYKGGAWMKSFYEANLFKPVYVRYVNSQDSYSLNAASAFYPSPSASGVEYIWAFITNFSYNVTKRLAVTDLVDINIEFTEI